MATHAIAIEQLQEESPPPSIQKIVEDVFGEFGLVSVGPPPADTSWTDDVPEDVVWKRTGSGELTFGLAEKFPAMYASIAPGLPSHAAGVSPGDRRFFVRRHDGQVAVWSLEPPRSGLFMGVMRRLRPHAGLSPQLWLMMQGGPWASVVQAWTELPDRFSDWPHVPFEPDDPVDLAVALRRDAEAAGCADAHELGHATGVVDARLRHLTTFARHADICLRRGETEPSPEQHLRDALGYGVDVLRCGAARKAAAADEVVASIYEGAVKALECAGWLCPKAAYLFASVEHAEQAARRASSYLYGTFRGRLP